MRGILEDFHKLANQTEDWMRDRLDRKAPGAKEKAEKLIAELKEKMEELRNLPDDPERLRREPDSLEEIRALRPAVDHSPRPVEPKQLASRMAGALNGRLPDAHSGRLSKCAPWRIWPLMQNSTT